jgi:hypothetical protein
MKLKILIIDYTTHHPEVVAALRELFSDHDVRLAVTSSFAAKFGRDFRIGPDTALIMPKKMAINAWLALVAPVIAQQDIVIFSTALRSPLLLKTLKLPTRAKKVAFVHNTHYFTERFPIDKNNYDAVFGESLLSPRAWLHYLRLRFKFFKRSCKHAVNGTQFRNITPHIDYFCFGNENLAAYFTELTGFTNTVTLPTSMAVNDLPRPPYADVLRIGVIGLVSPERRNYLSVIRTFDAAQLAGQLELHIFGRCPNREYAKQLTDLILELHNPQFKVIFDPNSAFIADHELRRRLLPIHLLLNPIQPYFLFQEHCEQYGSTKISGAEADCTRFNRPILMPSAYSASEKIKAFVVSYQNNEDLAKQIVALQIAYNLHTLYKCSDELAHNASIKMAAPLFLQQVRQT